MEMGRDCKEWGWEGILRSGVEGGVLRNGNGKAL